MLLESLALAAGLALLVFGSDWFVKGAVSIAERLGVSRFVIGLTLVAVGTSLPELASSVAASLEGGGDLVVGNVVGSNIANIGLIVGLAAVISSISASRDMDERDSYVMLLSAGLLLAFMLDGTVSRFEAALLLAAFAAYAFYLATNRPRIGQLTALGGRLRSFASVNAVFSARAAFRRIVNGGGRTGRDALMLFDTKLASSAAYLLAGLVAVVAGADLLVWGALGVSESLGVGSMVLGATVVAVGTSLPELSVTVSAARKGHADIALGNVLGSNIVNVLLVAGLAGVIRPIDATLTAAYFAVPVMLFMSLLLVAFLRTKRTVTRTEGVALLLLYGLFITAFVLLLA